MADWLTFALPVKLLFKIGVPGPNEPTTPPLSITLYVIVHVALKDGTGPAAPRPSDHVVAPAAPVRYVESPAGQPAENWKFGVGARITLVPAPVFSGNVALRLPSVTPGWVVDRRRHRERLIDERRSRGDVIGERQRRRLGDVRAGQLRSDYRRRSLRSLPVTVFVSGIGSPESGW